MFAQTTIRSSARVGRGLRASLIIILGASCLSLSAQQDAEPASAKKPSRKVRLVAPTVAHADMALRKGARLVEANKHFFVFEASAEVADELPLYQDVVVHGTDIHANQAVHVGEVRARGLNGGGVKVAVLDSGYNYLHPDLASSYLGGWDFVNHDADPMDDHYHGSHVAGIIASDGVLDSRSEGVAPAAGIVACKVLNQHNSGFLSTVAAAIYWVVDNHQVDVINMSLGSSAVYTEYCDGMYGYLTAAIQYANQHGAAVVVAAGNKSRHGAIAPACVEAALSVGATYPSLHLAYFSNYGPLVDISAPGSSLYSTIGGDRYGTLSGTSMATPMVAGALALLKQNSPFLDHCTLEDALLSGAQPGLNPRDNSEMPGLDLFGALEVLGLNRPPQVVLTTPSCVEFAGVTNRVVIARNGVDAEVVLDATSTTDPDGDSLTYQWIEDGVLVGSGSMRTNTLTIGSHPISLTVSDGFHEVEAKVMIEVVSLSDSMGILLALVASADLPPRDCQPLNASLLAAAASFERGNLAAGVNQLEAFQLKAVAQVLPGHPEVAEAFVDAAQVLIDVASK